MQSGQGGRNYRKMNENFNCLKRHIREVDRGISTKKGHTNWQEYGLIYVRRWGDVDKLQSLCIEEIFIKQQEITAFRKMPASEQIPDIDHKRNQLPGNNKYMPVK